MVAVGFSIEILFTRKDYLLHSAVDLVGFAAHKPDSYSTHKVVREYISLVHPKFLSARILFYLASS